ncbi:cytochrome P450 [Agrocybe pediades]|nr:cytochrome P450 [Agrocybe pediades]
MILTSLIFLAITLLWWCSCSSLRSSHGVPLPSGPPRDPIIGNLRIIPLQHTYKWFYELSKAYGSSCHVHPSQAGSLMVSGPSSIGKIVSLQVPEKTIIVVNSAKIATDLLDKRRTVYSKHPVSTMMMGWVKTLVFTQYGKDWVKHRKLLNDYFDPATSHSYEPYQAIVAQRLVKGLFENPGNFAMHVNRFTAAIIVHIIQGHEILMDDD